MTDYGAPPIGKVLVAGGLSLATVAAFVQPMYPTIGFWLLAASTGINAFAAYLGWGTSTNPPTP